MGVRAATLAIDDAGIERIDALYVGNMLADELQSQKNLAATLVDDLGFTGIEAGQASAASASGAAAIRMALMAVGSGQIDSALVIGLEKMSEGRPTPALAKALDRDTEQQRGETMISLNAWLMSQYLARYNPPEAALAHFSVNAHENACGNPLAMYNQDHISTEDVMNSRVIQEPLRLFDCSPISDGAAAIVLVASDRIRGHCQEQVRFLSSAVATDRIRTRGRAHPLLLEAAGLSTNRALRTAGLAHSDIDLFEVHDAFSILACLSLESAGFVSHGKGWRLATEGEISPNGNLPISTLGGLKARGHPIGATALYQACELVTQLTGKAGQNQVPNARIAMMQSFGGMATIVLTHILGGG